MIIRLALHELVLQETNNNFILKQMVITCFHDTSTSSKISTKRSYKDELASGMTQTGMIFLYWCSDQVNKYRAQNGN